jgi:hypothetical protein
MKEDKMPTLKRDPDNKLSLFMMGLRMEVQPYWLIKETINKNSQNILDELIEQKYKDALNAFSVWQSNVISSMKDEEDGTVIFEKNKYEVHHKEIQDIADISRDLLQLHSDAECIELTKEQQIAEEISFSYWRYNSFYGFKS